MSVTGLCQVCQARAATQRCGHCGAMVCAEHYDAESGFCSDCAAELGVGDDSPSRGPGPT